jgi:hypothetical protein
VNRRSGLAEGVRRGANHEVEDNLAPLIRYSTVGLEFSLPIRSDPVWTIEFKIEG